MAPKVEPVSRERGPNKKRFVCHRIIMKRRIVISQRMCIIHHDERGSLNKLVFGQAATVIITCQDGKVKVNIVLSLLLRLSCHSSKAVF